MISEMYYDAFANEYVTSKDLYAPPERYVFTKRGTLPSTYIEKMKVCQKGIERFFDIVFTEEEYSNYDLAVKRIKAVQEETGFAFTSGVCEEFTLPPEKFDEYANRFGLD